MTNIISAENDQQLSLFNTCQGAKVGRWCTLPLYPDRCYCLDPETFTNPIATHYFLTWVQPFAERRRYYRKGACVKCAPESRKLYRIPEGK